MLKSDGSSSTPSSLPSLRRQESVLYRKEFCDLTKLALPLVLAQLAQNTISFVDTVMVGRLGNEAIAGIAIGSTVFHFVLIVLSGVVLGVSPIVSQATGADDPQTAARATRQALWLGVIFSCPRSCCIGMLIRC